jgi:tRNA pseudouridine32 synthase / 23S rRNA pseudouridine746 synthase
MLRPTTMPTQPQAQLQDRPAAQALCIVHVDESFLIVNKPSGLLSVPGLGDAGQDNLTARLQARFEDALVVHRLDMATSGLMVFARGASAQRSLSIAFAQRQVHKRYVAVCEGLIQHESGSIDLPLIADWPRRPLQIVDHVAGKPALTHWRVQQRGADCTHLALQPVTGRSHQLRVHLQAIGHPIRGDALYAPAPLLAPRLLLHATHLAFVHPLSGAVVAFDSAAEF